MRKLPVVFTALCLIALVALPGIAQARQLHFGISANSRSGETAEDIGDIQDQAAETGVQWLREDIEWDQIEPVKGERDWTHTDSLFQEAAERGMTILPLVDSSPCWAVPKETAEEDCWRTFPTSNADFAFFVGKAVERYGPGGDFWEAHPGLDSELAPRYWEIWNEPYLAFTSGGQVEPARYAALYKAAVIAGREASASTRYLIESTVDAKIEEGVWVNWAKALKEAEPSLGSYIDGIAVHPYPASHDPDYEPENGTDASFKNTDVNYERWRAQGINKPVWITEVGYSACDDEADECVPGATVAAREEQKAEWLSDLFDELGENRYSFVHAVFLYNLQETGDPEAPDDNKEKWFGILGNEGEHLPAWTSFATAIEEFDGVPVPNSTIIAYSVKGSNASFSFIADDGTATFECQRDGGTWASCTSPKEYTGLTTGSHEFVVRASNDEATEGVPADMGWARRAPGTVADDAGTGTLTWSNVGNAKSSDNFYSSVEVPKSTTATAHYLKATNFGYTVPSFETIVGIQASIERSESSVGTGEVVDSRIRIVKGGTIQATGDKSTGAKWPT
ncbi:MAG TPA: hypothetical protein VNN15_00390, partial [Solirubrobacterales bacterium]|nr:hypothetical protein [Solirubrobacterales bacterium]